MSINKKAFGEDLSTFLEKYDSGENLEHLKEFISAALLYHLEDPSPEQIKPLKEGLDEIRESLAMFKKVKYSHKISLFGSARTPKEHPLYKLAYNFSDQAAREGFKIITGGGPGIMEAGNLGAGPENSFGLGLNLPFESGNNIFDEHPENLTLFNHFFSRKLTFYREANAIVICPGGFGTMDEIFQGLTCVQTGKYAVMPFVLLDAPDGKYWERFCAWVKDSLYEDSYINFDDMSLYAIKTDIGEALAYIKQFYRNFFSYISNGKNFFFQLKTKLSDAQINDLNSFVKDKAFTPFSFVRERYYNDSTLYVYQTTFDSMNLFFIRQAIDFINEF
jgi:uncharacterized protein (TIGR00730 family)